MRGNAYSRRAARLCAALLFHPPTGALAAGDDSPFTGEFLYTGELWQVASGGLSTGTRYLQNLDVSLTADLNPYGIPGGTLFVYGLSNNKSVLSADLIGDAQVISNIDNGRVYRVMEAWFQQELPGLGRGARYKLGLINLNNEFDVIETAGLFIGSSHGIGPDFSQTGENGPSIFPSSAPAILADISLAEGVRLSAGIFDAVPNDPDRPARHKLSLNEGALLVAEANYTAPGGMRLGLGAFTYTAAFEPLLALPGERVKGNSGLYGVIEAPLSERLSGWLRLGLANARINPVNYYTGGGLVLSAPFAGRKDDLLGLAVAIAWSGGDFKRLTRAGGGRPANAETEIELTYRFALSDTLALQPDLQYVINPGGTGALKNALVLGIRLEVGFGLF